MVIAEAFFDESGTNDDAKNLCIGGYVFEGESSAAFEAEWKRMLQRFDLPYFHMREFRQDGKGVFKHLSVDLRKASLDEAIKIIEKHATCGFAFSVDKEHFGNVVAGSPWTREYSFLVNQTFYGIEDRFRGRDAGSVNYVFENGAEGWGEAEKVFKETKKQPELEAKYRLGEFRRETKDGAVQLQAADLLVWSTLRERRRIDEGQKLGKHLEFKRLTGVHLYVHHWDGEAGNMIRWVRQVIGNDPAFLEWLLPFATPKFLTWLKASGPAAVNYFRAVFRKEEG
ncbi:DUF3800 domain-containing protein [Curvibacter gracilis]|uniref:DUF3800 domain-containing protein n=1 Tax=Curvibacter gracilis TaxID=230310 RepID=UPI0004886F10|nr:DUF3800 domain-containing protein [Curvibacter gracilis]